MFTIDVSIKDLARAVAKNADFIVLADQVHHLSAMLLVIKLKNIQLVEEVTASLVNFADEAVPFREISRQLTETNPPVYDSLPHALISPIPLAMTIGNPTVPHEYLRNFIAKCMIVGIA